MGAIASRPAAMNPGPLDERGWRGGVEFVDRVKSAVRAGEIFSVIPSAYDEHGTLDVLHMTREVASLPVGVVGVVIHLVIEEPVRALEVELFEVCGVADVEEKLVVVGGS